MPKVVEFPSSPFSKALELANAVDYFGGNCSLQSCADKVNKKISGGFGMLVSSSIKHNLISRKKDQLLTTNLYKNIKSAADSRQERNCLRKAFLSPVLYKKVYERFKGKDFPLPMLDKLLIREFAVGADLGSRIAGYFIDGLKSLHLLDGGKLVDMEVEEKPRAKSEDFKPVNTNIEINPVATILPAQPDVVTGTGYIIHVTGPGMDSTITINEAEDFFILEAITRKIKKQLQAN